MYSLHSAEGTTPLSIANYKVDPKVNRLIDVVVEILHYCMYYNNTEYYGTVFLVSQDVILSLYLFMFIYEVYIYNIALSYPPIMVCGQC